MYLLCLQTFEFLCMSKLLLMLMCNVINCYNISTKHWKSRKLFMCVFSHLRGSTEAYIDNAGQFDHATASVQIQEAVRGPTCYNSIDLTPWATEGKPHILPGWWMFKSLKYKEFTQISVCDLNMFHSLFEM